ncbi:unnamed protein product [Cladocopium goreaui]|uniref:Tyrosine specific protein phosphatases domain-containing protein n=1 Tax=Cladocopium goreaui TaxID=2562237 RepID=A0A9P1CDM4_9DINO|nr:unnamed protein product [Cladocopium goreaui]
MAPKPHRSEKKQKRAAPPPVASEAAKAPLATTAKAEGTTPRAFKVLCCRISSNNSFFGCVSAGGGVTSGISDRQGIKRCSSSMCIQGVKRSSTAEKIEGAVLLHFFNEFFFCDQPAKKQKVIQSKAMPAKGCPEWNAIYDLKFGKPLTELKDWLVVGGRFDLAKIPQKLQRKIAIINCQNREECDSHRQQCEGLGIPFLAMNPNFHRPLEKWAALFRSVRGIVENGRKTIVVVCNGGRHRSAAVACALLVLTDGLSVEAAEEYIFQRRAWAEPWETRWFVEWCEHNKEQLWVPKKRGG